MAGQRVAIITQARTSSTRLPGKIFRQVDERTLLDYHIDRLNQTQLPVIIATTDNACDDKVQLFAEERGILFFRGSEEDVLSRFYHTAKRFEINVIIRVTSDCPLIDPALITTGLNSYTAINNNLAYFSNCVTRTFPRGFDFEIFSFEALEEAYKQASKPSEREHVTPYIRNNFNRFIICDLKSPDDFSGLRITVDTEEDLILIEKLIHEHQCHLKNAQEIIQVLHQHPELQQINAHVEQKPA